MKNLRNLTLLLISLIVLNACSTATKKEGESTAKEEKCLYKYDNQSLNFTWTAYKFTTKKGVNGTFDDIKVTAADNASSLDALLNSVQFNINTGSVNSNEPARDVKISHFFFGTMANSNNITGSIKNVEGKNATVSLTLNDITVDIPGTIEMSGDTVKLKSTVDLKAFKGEEAVKKLNEVCSEKHTGDDGVSIFWDVVDVSVQAVVNKTCK